MGSTLEELKRQAPLATTMNGVSFEGNSAKIGAILNLAACGAELIAEIEAQRAVLGKFLDHFARTQAPAIISDDEQVSIDCAWFKAVDEAKALLGGTETLGEPYTGFAKLFTFEDIGQVLVLNDTNEEGKPEVRVHFQPPGLGVCASNFSFSSDEAVSAEDKADKAFAAMDRALAEKIVRQVLETLPAGLVQS